MKNKKDKNNSRTCVKCTRWIRQPLVRPRPMRDLHISLLQDIAPVSVVDKPLVRKSANTCRQTTACQQNSVSSECSVSYLTTTLISGENVLGSKGHHNSVRSLKYVWRTSRHEGTVAFPTRVASDQNHVFGEHVWRAPCIRQAELTCHIRAQQR